MKSVRKYYLVPENKYMKYLQKDKGDSSYAPNKAEKNIVQGSLSSSEEEKVEDNSNRETKASNYLPSTTDQIPEKVKTDVIEGPCNQTGGQNISDSTTAQIPVRPAPPPGQPARKKRQRTLSWITLK